MWTVDDALQKLVATITPLGVSQVPLSEALGLTLGADVISHSDSPPFDKSLMDGYAVRAEDVTAVGTSLKVIETVTAGRVPSMRVGPGEATQIMTGAPLPEGADVVIKVEDTRRDGDRVVVQCGPPTIGANLIRRGTSVRSGACVLSRGLTLNGARIGALAELGCAHVTARRPPKVSILATGDELVPIESAPGPGQIRNSNVAMLAAQVTAAGAEAMSLGIARDNRDDLLSKIREGLQSDLLVLSGGVSAGTLDLVPATLAEAGVEQAFHKVEMKPGKPLWFGQFRGVDRSASVSSASHSAYVFGLPGNPVSSMVCCEIFVRTAIRRLMGVDPATPSPIFAKLEHAYSTRADRPTYHPACLTWTKEGLSVRLVPWHGSSDLCGTVSANGMVFLSGEARQFQVGDCLPSYAW
ncbi:gephyrin-like molybdotransferase Glp [Schlesneria sp. T3-172]|uniref:molybdopterin molybdotransferase MoeA n=1 Tax=Schlesneria sphaerica TaxID=3373610 RepID=UPI0037C91464